MTPRPHLLPSCLCLPALTPGDLARLVRQLLVACAADDDLRSGTGGGARSALEHVLRQHLARGAATHGFSNQVSHP